MRARTPRARRHRLLSLGAVGAAILAACTFSAGVEDRVVDALPDASTCVAASTECLDGETLRTCAASGEAATDHVCAWGCRTTPFARCAEIVPAGSGVMPVDVAPSTELGVIVLEPGTTLDGDNGRIGTLANPNQYRGSGAPGVMNGIDYQVRGPIAVFRFNKLQIAGALTLIGNRSIALVADGDILVEGIVDARGGCAGSNAGPGGFAGGFKQGGKGSGSGGGAGAIGANEGGGGGGHGAAGGSGGNGVFAAGGGPTGDATISVLFGGAGGGGGSGGASSGSGGGGGGAFQLVSNSRILISGGINAGGCGGKTGTGGNDGGGGGGAGGSILIEGKLVELSGTLAVNGGGGGGGDGDAGGGANATLDRMPAAGSATAQAIGGSGGAGAVPNGAAGAGGADGGGGGGGVGRIRINTKTGAAAITGILSPSFDDPATTCTQGTATIR